MGVENCLAENNMKLVNFVINNKNLYIPDYIKIDMADLYQEGYVLLVKCAKNYDCKSGFKFSTYAVNSIYLGLRAFIDRNLKKKYSFEGYSLENEVYKNNIKNDGNLMWKDLLEIEECGFESIILEDFIKSSKVKDIDKIIGLKIQGYKIKEIQQLIGLSRWILDDRINRFKDEINKYYYNAS